MSLRNGEVLAPMVLKTEPWFNINILSCQYMKSYCGDKTISRPYYLHNGISYTDREYIESIKTTSMEDVSTGVLEEIKNIQEVKIKPKTDMMYQCIYNCIYQNTKKWRYTIHYVKPTAQLLFKMGCPILVRWHIFIESAPRLFQIN